MQNKKLELKCKCLLALVNSIQNYYQSDLDEMQKSYLETVVGAAIWYQPKMGEDLWDGSISIKALHQSLNDVNKGQKPKLSEDHKFPRKYSAQQLLNGNWCKKTYTNDVEGLMKYYIDVAGMFTYVTQSQNKELVKFQKIGKFITPKKTYEKAGVKFLDAVSQEEIKNVKKGDKKTIKQLISRI